jgi:hypothetical protein
MYMAKFLSAMDKEKARRERRALRSSGSDQEIVTIAAGKPRRPGIPATKDE